MSTLGILGLHGGLAAFKKPFHEVQKQSKQLVDRLDALMKERKDDLAEEAGYTDERCKELQDLENTFSRADEDMSFMEKMAARSRRLNEVLKEIQSRDDSQPTPQELEQESQDTELAREVAFRAFALISADENFEIEFTKFWGPEWNQKFIDGIGLRSLTPAAAESFESQETDVDTELYRLRGREAFLEQQGEALQLDLEKSNQLIEEQRKRMAEMEAEHMSQVDALKSDVQKAHDKLVEWEGWSGQVSDKFEEQRGHISALETAKSDLEERNSQMQQQLTASATSSDATILLLESQKHDLEERVSQLTVASEAHSSKADELKQQFELEKGTLEKDIAQLNQKYSDLKTYADNIQENNKLLSGMVPRNLLLQEKLDAAKEEQDATKKELDEAKEKMSKLRAEVTDRSESTLDARTLAIFRAAIDDNIAAFSQDDPLSALDQTNSLFIVLIPQHITLLVVDQATRQMRWMSMDLLDTSDLFNPVIRTPDQSDGIAFTLSPGQAEMGIALIRERLRQNPDGLNNELWTA
ncbi:hypothetical protein FDECE_11004 [Fusarium decemcellulare]|nr:hypothetical protein FDECE_11004 [Fusarium decemcellulare]